MSDQQLQKTAQSQLTIKGFFSQDNVKAKFAELLGKRAPGFITSVLQVVMSNTLLQKADANSIYNAAAMAATLDLPVVNSLGHAWIVPYAGKAQFQIGWKGFVQLAQRSGQYETINVIPIYKHQFKSWNPLTEELDADFSFEPYGEPVGYVAKFKLVTGFVKTDFWPKWKVEDHGKRYSKSFTSGPWKTDFDSMAMKTVLKSILSKWGPLSIELRTAIMADQAIIEDLDEGSYSYPDNEQADIPESNPKVERVKFMLDDLKTRAEVVKFIAALDTSEFTQEEWNAISLYKDSLSVK